MLFASGNSELCMCKSLLPVQWSSAPEYQRDPGRKHFQSSLPLGEFVAELLTSPVLCENSGVARHRPLGPLC